MTPIAIPIFVEGVEQTLTAMRQAQAALEGAAGIVELRCDTAPAAVMEEVLRARAGATSGLPVIVTLRSKAEGGGFTGGESALAEAIEQAARYSAEYVDVEFAAWQRSAELRRRLSAICQQSQRGIGPAIILSAHDFAGRPADLRERIAAMAAVEPATMIKIAWKAASVMDAIEALALIEETRRRFGWPLLALAMGEFGQISRLLGAKFGQPFTFATLGRGAESAPGQPTVRELLHLYRWTEQRPGTAVCGVIGWPVSHSMSPAIHNAGFAEMGYGGVYVPLAIEPAYEQFAAVVDALRACPGMNLRGLSVTIPHKENAIRYVRERDGRVDELSSHIGAVNTLLFGASNDLYGFNSDYAGALDALAGAMGIERTGLAGRRVAVLGAGGAARAIVAGLAHCGATTVVYNRSLERAEALALEFDGTPGKVVAARLDQFCKSCCEITINCTPIGMHPNSDVMPVDADAPFRPGSVVFDTIYNPLETRLLKVARQRGATVIAGAEMFVGQAGLQFEAFTGMAAPRGTFRRILLEALGG